LVQGNTVTGGAFYPYAYEESGTPLSTTLGFNYFQSGTSTCTFKLNNSNTSNAFFNNADFQCNPGNAVYWGQVDSGGNLHFNAPTGQSIVSSINGTPALTVSSLGSTVAGTATSTNGYVSTKLNIGSTLGTSDE